MTKKNATKKKKKEEDVIELNGDIEPEEVQEVLDESRHFGMVYPSGLLPYAFEQDGKFFSNAKLEVDEKGDPVTVKRKMRECSFCDDEYFMTPREMQGHIREHKDQL